MLFQCFKKCTYNQSVTILKTGPTSKIIANDNKINENIEEVNNNSIINFFITKTRYNPYQITQKRAKLHRWKTFVTKTGCFWRTAYMRVIPTDNDCVERVFFNNELQQNRMQYELLDALLRVINYMHVCSTFYTFARYVQ